MSTVSTLSLEAPNAATGEEHVADALTRRQRWVATLSKAERRALKQVGIRIAAARRRRGLTRSELAAASNVNSSHLGSIERGENNTTLLVLLHIAESLEVAVTTLLEPIRAE